MTYRPNPRQMVVDYVVAQSYPVDCHQITAATGICVSNVQGYCKELSTLGLIRKAEISIGNTYKAVYKAPRPVNPEADNWVCKCTGHYDFYRVLSPGDYARVLRLGRVLRKIVRKIGYGAQSELYGIEYCAVAQLSLCREQSDRLGTADQYRAGHRSAVKLIWQLRRHGRSL